MRRARFISILLLVSATLLAAQSRDLSLSRANRKALVIGNDAYTQAPPLDNATNDASDLGESLRDLGFAVTVATDVDEEAMERAIQKFTDSIQAGDVALFHYSGHGFQSEGDNYLAPVDIDTVDEIGARHHSYSTTEVHERMVGAGAALSIMTLDACRNNRFQSFRGGARGLAMPAASAEGSYVAFATAPGSVADDNPQGRNGRFSGALIAALAESGLELDQVFRRVRAKVSTATGGKQIPWSSSSVTGEFYFRIVEEAQPATASVDGTVPPAQPPGRVSPPAPVSPAVTPVGNERRAGDTSAATINGVRMEFVWVPAGEFAMGCSAGDSHCSGDESPTHRVRITKGFEMGKHEVTQAQWEAVMGSGSNPSHLKGADRPVESVSWEDVQKYISRLNQMSGDDYRYRLPTEAEWEFAARAGTTGARYGNLDAGAWNRGNSESKTHTVGGKRPNAWGLHDMLGNVWEWCQDWYGEDYYRVSPGSDPKGPAPGESRTLRGGSWVNNTWNIRASYRTGFTPSERYFVIGFRLARER